MTPSEHEVIGHLIAAWNSFLKLPVEHDDDTPEFRRGIHQLQEKILARPARRALATPS